MSDTATAAETATLSTRISVELREQIEKLAEQERRPISHMTMLLLEEAVAARSKKAKK